MKITVNIDCTPEEAREFLGFPNIQPMQEKVMKQMEDNLLAGIAGMSPDAILRNWMSFNPEKIGDMFKMFGGMAGGAAKK
ncbi:DUF6489 family protein [Bradyrhizobium sp. G127]|uniref:DUF6489 family protein n=1 Tax=Bradyrhizobium sp. G127 TaxID=2904800 RepID=UPI001F3D2534|nr:DUF6489 family protein [Bradyrhizobium sp. G127]